MLVRVLTQSAPIARAASPAQGAARPMARIASDRSPTPEPDVGPRARISRVSETKPVGQLAPPLLRLVIGASVVVLGLLVLALRRVWQSGAPLAASDRERDHRSGATDLEDAIRIDDVDASGLRHRLGAIDSWARTLDDRWPTLTEADKRIAVQIILRNSRAAIDELSREQLVSA